MQPVREKVSHEEKFTLDFNCQPITSRDTPPTDINKHGRTNMQASTSVSREEGDFYGNVICIISSGMAQLIRYEGKGL